ncbi:hypothetical protein [Clostridium omnivorum]|uniref:Uncharacterized protein n=1 Tax=Clostridium omnivorum TaxID=1604902 RepID=A0ABQ5N6M7_9CLOT|nr:hypothetical protein [Clostridium sp. E14]GLC30857.1 hypothetical protein bsdE14_22670 [Clostridium sp. E14]
MNNNNSEVFAIQILEKVQLQLKEIEIISTDYRIKEKIHKLLDYIDLETSNTKAEFAEMIHLKVKETKPLHPELSTYLYLLYRNLMQGKISLQEAQGLYEMYMKEYMF